MKIWRFHSVQQTTAFAFTRHAVQKDGDLVPTKTHYKIHQVRSLSCFLINRSMDIDLFYAISSTEKKYRFSRDTKAITFQIYFDSTRLDLHSSPDLCITARFPKFGIVQTLQEGLRMFFPINYKKDDRLIHYYTDYIFREGSLRILRSGLPESFKRCSMCELSIRFTHEGRLFTVFDQAKWALGGGGSRKHVLNVVRLQAQPQYNHDQPQSPTPLFDPSPSVQPILHRPLSSESVVVEQSKPMHSRHIVQPIQVQIDLPQQDQYIALLQQQLQRQPQQQSMELLHQLLEQQQQEGSSCCTSPVMSMPSSDDEYDSSTSAPVTPTSSSPTSSPQPMFDYVQPSSTFDFISQFENNVYNGMPEEEGSYSDFMDSDNTFFSYFGGEGEDDDDNDGGDAFYPSSSGGSTGFRYNCANPQPAVAPVSPFFRGIIDVDADSEDYSLLASSTSICFEQSTKYFIMQCNTQIIIISTIIILQITLFSLLLPPTRTTQHLSFLLHLLLGSPSLRLSSSSLFLGIAGNKERKSSMLVGRRHTRGVEASVVLRVPLGSTPTVLVPLLNITVIRVAIVSFHLFFIMYRGATQVLPRLQPLRSASRPNDFRLCGNERRRKGPKLIYSRLKKS